MKKKYISKFNKFGISKIDVDLIAEDWNETFNISTWDNGKETNYFFIINPKRKNAKRTKTYISEEQAKELIEKLNLVHVKSHLFLAGGSYHTKEFVKSETEKLESLKKEKESELLTITRTLYQYRKVNEKI